MIEFFTIPRTLPGLTQSLRSANLNIQAAFPLMLELPGGRKAERLVSILTYPHIERSSDGFPCLAGTQTKVVEIVLDRLAHNWDADEIQRQHPHLTLAQIHAALAFYYDHQGEIDTDIDRRLREAEKLRGMLEDPGLRAMLKAARSIP